MNKRILKINTYNINALTKLHNKNRPFMTLNQTKKCYKDEQFYIDTETKEKYYILKQNQEGLINKRQAEYVEDNLYGKYVIEKVKRLAR